MERFTFDLGEGVQTSISVRIQPRARRISVRMDVRAGEPVLTLPPRVSLARALPFLERHRDWLRRHCAHAPPNVALVDGATLPLRGDPHLIRTIGGPRHVTADDGVIAIGGPPEFAAKRLMNWLRAEAKNDLAIQANWHAESFGHQIDRISIRDTTSRWGSCSSSGTLSFCWRLILAPPEVLDYVAAHEAAHLVEMNHTDRFWTLVERRIPDWRRRREWLREHGPGLHAYG